MKVRTIQILAGILLVSVLCAVFYNSTRKTFYIEVKEYPTFTEIDGIFVFNSSTAIYYAEIAEEQGVSLLEQFASKRHDIEYKLSILHIMLESNSRTVNFLIIDDVDPLSNIELSMIRNWLSLPSESELQNEYKLELQAALEDVGEEKGRKGVPSKNSDDDE